MSTLYVVLALMAVPFILAICLARRDHRGTGAAAVRAAWRHSVDGPIPAEDLFTLIHQIATEMEPIARAHRTRLSLAITPGQALPANPGVLRSALREILEATVRAAEGGVVLISTRPLGTQLHILITDDGAAALDIRERVTFDAAAAIALQGGSATVASQAGRGTTVTMRFPLPLPIPLPTAAASGGPTRDETIEAPAPPRAAATAV